MVHQSISEASNCALAAIQQDEGVIPLSDYVESHLKKPTAETFKAMISLVGLAGWRSSQAQVKTLWSYVLVRVAFINWSDPAGHPESARDLGPSV